MFFIRLGGEKTEEKIMLSPETCFHYERAQKKEKLNGEVDQELINGNHWRHIAMCTRHRSDDASSVGHDEIEICHVEGILMSRLVLSINGTSSFCLVHRKFLFFSMMVQQPDT
jgi:hypothetical protein